jgi:hypothetical protein
MIEDKRMILEQGRRKAKPVVATINVANPIQLSSDDNSAHANSFAASLA